MNKSHRLHALLAMLLVVALCLSIVPVITMAAPDTRAENEEITFSSAAQDRPAEEEEGDIHIPIGSLPTQPSEPSQPTEPESVPGDFTGDDSVTNDDVIALLWHVLFPDTNPINGNPDLNKDNSLTNDDVIILLWYVLFPEQNPLP